MHDYADALWIRHWNIKRYGKTRMLVGCLSKKKHSARLRGSGELNMVCSCRRAALQGRHQRTKLAQSCQNCYGNTSPQQIQTPLPVLWRSPLRVPSISIRLNLPITTCSSVPVSHSFFHFSAFLAHCLSQSLSQWAVSIKRWSTFESAASLKSSHLFLLYFPSRLLTSSLICCSIFNTRPFPFFSFTHPALFLSSPNSGSSFSATFPLSTFSSSPFDPVTTTYCLHWLGGFFSLT